MWRDFDFDFRSVWRGFWFVDPLSVARYLTADAEGSTSYIGDGSVNVEHCLDSSVSVTRCGDDDEPRSLDINRRGVETGRAVSVRRYTSNFELILRQSSSLTPQLTCFSFGQVRLKGRDRRTWVQQVHEFLDSFSDESSPRSTGYGGRLGALRRLWW